MQIDIHTQDFALTDSLRKHAERRLFYALSCCEDFIQRIEMRLSDINDLHGGADKRCQLRVILDDLPDVVTDDIESDFYIAIERASDRSGRTVIRKIKRE